MDGAMELDEVARQAGVHYQTVYRWVRSGRLAASMVQGRYRVRPSDLEAFLTERSAPTVGRAPSAARLSRTAEKMYDVLVAGDENQARDLARGIVTEQTPVVELIQKVLVPPLVRIGQEWHDGNLSIWVEHRASAIVERVLGELAPRRRGRKRGAVMVAAVSGDRHTLPTTMAAVTLRDNNWVVHHLGADMPPDELVAFCAEHDVDVAVVTLANPECRDLAHQAADMLRAGGTPVTVGGAGRTLDDLLDEVAELSRQPG